MKTKINFYGASITQQKNGYVTYLSNFHPEWEIQRSGHGGMNIANAAICYIKNVVNQTPQYCFLDWFINAPSCMLEGELIINYVDAVVYNLVLNKITPVFLLMYGDSNQLTPKKLCFYEKIEKYCDVNNIHYISLYKEDEVLHSVEQGIPVVEDGIHTNDHGSKLYAEIIGRFIKTKLSQTWHQTCLPNINKYCNVNSLVIDKTITDKINIFGDFEIIGIEQIVGPYSPWVTIDADNLYVESVCIWDPYCHYERRQMTITGKCKHSICITIQKNEPIDYSKCRREWTYPRDLEKKLKFHAIYYIGNINQTEIIN